MHVKVGGGLHVKLEDGRANLQCCGRKLQKQDQSSFVYPQEAHGQTHKHKIKAEECRHAKDAYAEHAIFY